MSFDDWKTITFGEFVAIQRGHDLPDQNRRSGNVPILGSFGITGYHDTVKAKGAGVTIGRSGSSFGVATYTDEDYWPLNTALYVTDFKGNYPKFVYYFMKLFDFSSFNSGTAQASLNRNNLYPVNITVPSSRTQREIADFFSALDNRISLLRETNTTLEAIAQTLFKSWFVDFEPVKAKAEGRLPEGMDEATAALFPSEFEESVLGFIPKGWKVEKLGDIVQRITKGTTPTTFKKPFVSSGINFIKAESMTEDGDFIPDKFAFIDSDTHELLRRSQLQSGDVLITIAGTIGRMAIITEEFLPANTNQAVAIIRPISEHLPSGLLSLFLQTSALREVMDGKIVQAVQANLSLTSLSDLQLVIPPKQTVFMLYQVGIAHIDDVKKHNRSTIRTLTTLRDTLLPRLISGQLRLNQAQDLVDEVTA